MDLHARIEEIRQKLGFRLLVLGHHYQKEEVIRHTDLRGDSFQLSSQAADRTDCETIVFCGVHFMAETVDILVNREEQLQKRGGRRIPVVLPDLQAGCDMADLANEEQVQRCWSELGSVLDTNEITPITYVNSSAPVKAFCGKNGGSACTSSNAKAVLQWAFSQRERVLFFPDQHLGRNTALEMGIAENAISCWDPNLPMGGLSPEKIRGSRVILWNGYCIVHQKFLPEHVDAVRKTYPDIQVIVHLECSRDVVEKSDFAGSTSLIVQKITESPPGSRWAVGTEWRLVQRLISMFPDKTIVNLSPEVSLCETMNRITLENLAFSLECIDAARTENIIRVEENTAKDALRCLQQMLLCK